MQSCANTMASVADAALNHHSSTSSRHSGMARQLKLTATSTLTRAALADYYRPTMVSIFRKRVVGASIRHLFNRQLGCYLYPRRTIALMEALSLARNQRLCTSAEQPIGKWRHRRKSVWIWGRCGVSDRVWVGYHCERDPRMSGHEQWRI